MKITYFVHGTTYDNESGKCSGHSDVKLSELGKEQAVKLGEIYKDTKFDVVFTSDLTRAVTSADLAFGYALKIKDERLRECNYGNLDGKDKSLIVYEDHIEEPFENGESLIDVEKRMRSFIAYLKENYEGKKVAIVAHRAPQLAIEVISKKISWQEANQNDWRKKKAWKPGWEYEI